MAKICIPVNPYFSGSKMVIMIEANMEIE
jgi:hypothetical protein